MEHYAGIDVSLESASVCVVDGTGRIVREARVASEPEALATWFTGLGLELVRVGLEAGPLSQWLHAGLRQVGLPVELLETRHVRGAFKAMPVKTDRKDAQGIAQLMRLGWFRPVHCKSLPAQEVRALLTSRKLLQAKHHDVEMDLRGILRRFRLKVGKTTPKTFEHRVRELVADHPTLLAIAVAMLAARAGLGEQLVKLEKRVRAVARGDQLVRRLMSAPGVGAIVALTFVAAIDDPARFRSSKAVGAHFGLTPKKYQSGETDVTGRISKIGDAEVRTALYEAANVILSRPVKSSLLKSWAARLAARAGMRKAKVALARKRQLFCIACWRTARRSSPRCQRAGHSKEGKSSVRANKTPVARSRSRRRDDGSGQAAQLIAAALDCAHREIGRPILIRLHQVAASRRPRTEARHRRQG
jgi:transposase